MDITLREATNMLFPTINNSNMAAARASKVRAATAPLVAVDSKILRWNRP